MQATACVVYSFGRCTVTATKGAPTSWTMQHGLMDILDMDSRQRTAMEMRYQEFALPRLCKDIPTILRKHHA